MNNSEVGVAFALQRKAKGTGSNMYFHGPIAYSYGPHYVAATHHGDCILLNGYGYSNTTKRHLSHYWRGAYFNGLAVYTVENPEASTPEEHAANFAKLREGYAAEVARAGRARKYTSLEHAARMAGEANKYAERFGIPDRIEHPA